MFINKPVSAVKRIISVKPKKPLYIFCYHKVGTVLLGNVFKDISRKFGWRFRAYRGKQTQQPRNCDVALFCHSLVDFTNFHNDYIGIHIIRDPRDIILSGYLYHKKTSEKWCVYNQFDLNQKPITFPQVPYSQVHRSEKWKESYIRSLGGKSYKENLLSMSQKSGIEFEMNHYAAWTINEMASWDYSNQKILEIKFEDLITNFDDTFLKIFDQFNLSQNQTKLALPLAVKHDLDRKSAHEVSKIEHVTGTQTNKWRECFEQEQIDKFETMFPGVLNKLRYKSFDQT